MKAKRLQRAAVPSHAITSVSDLAQASKKLPIVLRGGTAFMYRLDGLPGLKVAYNFEPGQVEPQYIEHSEVYDDLEKPGAYTVAVGYGTDWQLHHKAVRDKYVALHDDQNFSRSI